MFFSIAIPAYKSQFLVECINSVINQTYRDFELIIVDDCSPENVSEIVSRFNDSRIRFFKNDVNIGGENLVKNWNNCLEKATGDYFVMMGDDDKMEPNFLEEFVSLIERFPGLNVYHCRSKIIDEKSNFVALTPSWPERETVYDSIWHRIKSIRLQYVSDFVYNTVELKKNGGFFFTPLAWAADDITAYNASIANGIAHTNVPLLNYRETPYTLSSSGNYKLKVQAVLLEQSWLNSFLEEVPSADIDKVIRLNIIKIKDVYFLLKKREYMTLSYEKYFFRNIIFWYNNRDVYKISAAEIMKAAIPFFLKKIKGKR